MQTPYRLTGATMLRFGNKFLPETYLLIITDRDVQFQMLSNLQTIKDGHALLYISEHAVTPVHVRCNQPFDVEYILFGEDKKAISYGWIPRGNYERAVYIKSFNAKYILFFPENQVRKHYETAHDKGLEIRMASLHLYQLSGINIER
jgi:hypothetical protein